ncbi:MAG: hypothetical protein AB7D51_12775 [Desulfovibrionaceae bacterium]
MDGIDGIGGGGMDGKTFGAAVVKETLDRMNTDAGGGLNADYQFQNQVLGAYAGTGGADTVSLSGGLAGQAGSAAGRETLGAAVVSDTLDRMNTDPMGNVDKDYEFQKQVLAAGAVVDRKG